MKFLLSIGALLSKLIGTGMEILSKDEKDNPQTGGNKLSGLLSTLLGYAFAIILVFIYMSFNDLKTKTSTLEERVSFLYQDKVSRAEFREEMTQIRLQAEANKTDIIARQETMKSDVLARIDLLIPHITGIKKDK